MKNNEQIKTAQLCVKTDVISQISPSSFTDG